MLSDPKDTAASVASRETILMAVYNMKGGVAKTTSTLEFAYHLAQDGFKVLLIDADMQANLTSNIMLAANADLLSSRPVDEAEEVLDEKYDRLWQDINEREEKEGFLITFHRILQEFTGTRQYLSKAGSDSVISKIKPLSALDGIDYIAGHMHTAEQEEKISDGFRVETRHAIPGMVTNVFREYANQNGYDFVIFDLGCTLTSIVKAVLLGSDYIISPFKCERACVTAAEIVMKKLRDWHTLGSEDPILRIREKTMSDAVREKPSEISVALKCYPVFLGAFPIAVKVINHKTKKLGAVYEVRIAEIFRRYKEDINKFRHCKRPLVRPDLERLEKLWVENSESAGREAEGGNKISYSLIPCVSLCYDQFRAEKGSSLPRDMQSFVDKCGKVSGQYKSILKALFRNLKEEHKALVSEKSKALFKHLLLVESSSDHELIPSPKGKKAEQGEKKRPLTHFYAVVSPRKRMTRTEAGVLAAIFDEAIRYAVYSRNVKPVDLIRSPHKKLEKVDAGGGGDCLFRSIAATVGEYSHHELRAMLVAAIESDKDTLRPLIEAEGADIMLRHNGNPAGEKVDNIDRYIELMALPGTWGGQLELVVLAKVLARPIAQIVPGLKPIVYPSKISAGQRDFTGTPIYVYFDGAGHYQQLRVKGDLPDAERQEIFDDLLRKSLDEEDPADEAVVGAASGVSYGRH